MKHNYFDILLIPEMETVADVIYSSVTDNTSNNEMDVNKTTNKAESNLNFNNIKREYKNRQNGLNNPYMT